MWWHLLAFVLRRAPGSEFGISGTGRGANTGAGKVNLSIPSLGPVKDSDRQISVSLRAQVRNWNSICQLHEYSLLPLITKREHIYFPDDAHCLLRWCSEATFCQKSWAWQGVGSFHQPWCSVFGPSRSALYSSVRGAWTDTIYSVTSADKGGAVFSQAASWAIQVQQQQKNLKKGCTFSCRSGPCPGHLLQMHFPLLKPKVVSLDTAVSQQPPHS